MGPKTSKNHEDQAVKNADFRTFDRGYNRIDFTAGFFCFFSASSAIGSMSFSCPVYCLHLFVPSSHRFLFSVFFVHCSLSSSSLSSSSHDFIFLLLLLVLLLPPNPLPLLLPLFLPLLCRLFIVIPVLIWTWFFFGDVSCRLLILDPYYRWVVVVLIVVVVVVVALDVIVLLAVAGYQLLSSPHLCPKQ